MKVLGIWGGRGRNGEDSLLLLYSLYTSQAAKGDELKLSSTKGRDRASKGKGRGKKERSRME